MNKVEKIKAEIERRIKSLNKDRDFNYLQIKELEALLSFSDSLEEEPVSIDFEQELCKAFGQVKDFTLGMQIAKWFYDMGKNSQEPVSEELSDAANDYVVNIRKGYPRVMDETDKYIYNAFKAGAQWQKANLWKDAQGDDLPEIDREVIVLAKALPEHEDSLLKVSFAHRPPEYWMGKSISTGEITRYEPKRYDKGGWNQPNVVYWLDVELPKEEE